MVSCLSKMVRKGVKGFDLGAEPPHIKLSWDAPLAIMI